MQRPELNFLKLVSDDPYALQAMLRLNTNLVNHKDREGYTLLHRLLNLSAASSEPHARFTQIFTMIIQTTGIDFNVANDLGNTALQYAVKMSGANSWLLKLIVKPLIERAAASSKTNFNQFNHNGKSVLHLACELKSALCVEVLLKAVDKKVALTLINTVSLQDQSPLYIACINGNFVAANMLLAAGADPFLCGTRQEFNPANYIKRVLRENTEKLTALEQKHKGKPTKGMMELKNHIDVLEGLRASIYNQPYIQNLIEAHKNARALNEIARETRRQNQLFGRIPPDIRREIAARLNDSTLLPEAEYHKILGEDIYNRRNFVINKVKAIGKNIIHLESDIDFLLENNKDAILSKQKNLLRQLYKKVAELHINLERKEPIAWAKALSDIKLLCAAFPKNSYQAGSRIGKQISELPREIESIQNYLKNKQAQEDDHLLEVKSVEKRKLASAHKNPTTSPKPPRRTTK